MGSLRNMGGWVVDVEGKVLIFEECRRVDILTAGARGNQIRGQRLACLWLMVDDYLHAWSKEGVAAEV